MDLFGAPGRAGQHGRGSLGSPLAGMLAPLKGVRGKKSKAKPLTFKKKNAEKCWEMESSVLKENTPTVQ